MKFDAAIQSLAHTAWDWTEDGFAAVVAGLGLVREPDADPEMPAYATPWGKEWAQAIIEDGSVHRLELLVEEKSPTWRPFTSRKLVALTRKFRDKLDVYVKRVAAVKGTPSFLGEPDAAGFPIDEDAHVLALWPAENARLMLTLRNLGPDTPVWISIVLRPPAAGRSPASRQSSSSLLGPPRRPSTSAVFRPGTARPTTIGGGALALDPLFVQAIEAIGAIRWKWSPEALPSLVEAIPLLAAPSPDPLRLEFVVESTRLTSFGDDDFDLLDEEYSAKYERYVEAATQILGRPKFNDNAAARGFPDDERVESGHEKVQFLALWLLKTARVMLIYLQDGADQPFEIKLVVKPR